jgi:hypothetical protein
MTIPGDKRRKGPVDRFKSILSDSQKRDDTVEVRRTTVANLPKARPVERTAKVNLPGSATPPETAPRLSRDGILPIFWTLASIISLTMNVVLLIVLVSLLQGLSGVDALGMGTGLLSGLYSNFERMDQAHIRTNIPVQTDIPLTMSIPVQTTTGITLAQDAVIRNAHVKISTATFNIDSPADVTLPAGTPLVVILDFTVPVQTQVPVILNVPVDIPIQATELHPAILGLQDTIKPLYCMVSPSARSLLGTPVCR